MRVHLHALGQRRCRGGRRCRRAGRGSRSRRTYWSCRHARAASPARGPGGCTARPKRRRQQRAGACRPAPAPAARSPRASSSAGARGLDVGGPAQAHRGERRSASGAPALGRARGDRCRPRGDRVAPPRPPAAGHAQLLAGERLQPRRALQRGQLQLQPVVRPRRACGSRPPAPRAGSPRPPPCTREVTWRMPTAANSPTAAAPPAAAAPAPRRTRRRRPFPDLRGSSHLLHRRAGARCAPGGCVPPRRPRPGPPCRVRTLKSPCAAAGAHRQPGRTGAAALEVRGRPASPSGPRASGRR